MAKAANRPTAASASRSMPARADATPIAAPDTEQPPRGDPGVRPRRRSEAAVRVRKREDGGRNPRFQRRRCAGAHFALPFTLVRTTGRYSNAVFRGLNRLLVAAFVAGVVSRGAVSGACLRRRTVGAERLHGVSAERRRPRWNRRPESAARAEARDRLPSPSKTAKAIKQAGKNSRALPPGSDAALRRALESSSQESATPSAVGSAFDLGSGPTALLLALAGTAVLLLGGSGLRVWRRSHRA